MWPASSGGLKSPSRTAGSPRRNRCTRLTGHGGDQLRPVGAGLRCPFQSGQLVLYERLDVLPADGGHVPRHPAIGKKRPEVSDGGAVGRDGRAGVVGRSEGRSNRKALASRSPVAVPSSALVGAWRVEIGSYH